MGSSRVIQRPLACRLLKWGVALQEDQLIEHVSLIEIATIVARLT